MNPLKWIADLFSSGGGHYKHFEQPPIGISPPLDTLQDAPMLPVGTPVASWECTGNEEILDIPECKKWWFIRSAGCFAEILIRFDLHWERRNLLYVKPGVLSCEGYAQSNGNLPEKETE